MKRICSKCKLPILKAHRWRNVHRKFLFWTFTKTEHRDCNRPTEIHKHVIRLKGEVPLPFDEYSVGVDYGTKDGDRTVAAVIKQGQNGKPDELVYCGEVFDESSQIKPAIYKKDVN